ncbi:SDR family NAD(P)-dependent oxidoreductase [Streptomyces sp. M19]
MGAGMARALARAGAAVMVGDIRESAGRETAAALRETGGVAGFVPLDVTEEASWEAAVGRTIAELGGLDVVVNNAGVEFSALIAELDPEEVRRMLEVNVLGVALGLKYAMRTMRPGGAAGRGGAVVNVSSVAATIPFPASAGTRPPSPPSTG